MSIEKCPAALNKCLEALGQTVRAEQAQALAAPALHIGHTESTRMSVESAIDNSKNDGTWAELTSDDVATIAELRKQLARCERSEEQLMTKRDNREDLLEQFVEIAGGVETCGEHSNMNSPWHKATNVLRDQLASRSAPDELPELTDEELVDAMNSSPSFGWPSEKDRMIAIGRACIRAAFAKMPGRKPFDFVRWWDSNKPKSSMTTYSHAFELCRDTLKAAGVPVKE